jgi:signal transduction histidine kinase
MLAIRAGGEMEARLWRMQASAMEALEQGRRHFPPDVREHEMSFERMLEFATEKAGTPRERDTVKAIREQFTIYRGKIQHDFEENNASSSGALSSPMEAMHLATNVASPCRDFATIKQEMLLDSLDRYARLTRGVNSLRLILFCSGPVLGVLLGILVARSLRSSIHQIIVRLNEAAGFNQDIGRVEISAAGELPALDYQVQRVVDRLTNVAGELARSREEAERSERLAAAGELAAGVAHELRNPLTSVKLVVQTAARKHRDRPLSERQFQILQDEIYRMERSIQSLLDLSRPPKMRRSLHNVCTTLRRSLNLVRTRAGQNGVQIFEGIPNERIMLQGDAEQLHQVFVNLLLNAMQAMPDGGTLRVGFGPRDATRGVCQIRFVDSGTGIPLEMLDRIFEPFVSGRESGYGLGLAVSRRIVTEHGGTISAANRPEGGASFTVVLPIVSIETDTIPPTSDVDIPVHSVSSDPAIVIPPAAQAELSVSLSEVEDVQTTGH